MGEHRNRGAKKAAKILPDLNYARVIPISIERMGELLGLLVGGAAIWFVVDALRAREAAIRIVREACRDYGVQLLDDAVHGARLSIVRDSQGVARLRRRFVFEFSEDGFSRRNGYVVLLGHQLESLRLDPYRVP